MDLTTTQVICRFLLQRPAAGHSVCSSGLALYSYGQVLAYWDRKGVKSEVGHTVVMHGHTLIVRDNVQAGVTRASRSHLLVVKSLLDTVLRMVIEYGRRER